jgi:hypothetical protein
VSAGQREPSGAPPRLGGGHSRSGY